MPVSRDMAPIDKSFWGAAGISIVFIFDNAAQKNIEQRELTTYTILSGKGNKYKIITQHIYTTIDLYYSIGKIY